MVDPDFTRKSSIKIYCVPSFSNKEKYCMFPLCALARSLHFSNTKKKIVAQWAQTQSVIFHSAVPMPVLSCQSEQDMSLVKSLYGLSFLLAESQTPHRGPQGSTCWSLTISPASLPTTCCSQDQLSSLLRWTLCSLYLLMLCPWPGQDRDASCSTLPKVNSYLYFRSLSR